MKTIWLGILILPLFASGCVEHQLRISTNSLIPTLRSIQDDQILDNLAAFLGDPHSVPVQACVTGGGVQVADQLQPSFKFPFHGFGAEADLQLQGQLTENWSLAPVDDADDLQRLRVLYQRATALTNDDPGFINSYVGYKKDSNDNTPASKFVPAVGNLPPASFASLTQTATYKFLRRDFSGSKIFITSPEDWDNFKMWIVAAMSNTSGGGSGGGGGGKKGLEIYQRAL